MAARNHRPSPTRPTRQTSKSVKAETKLAQWGSCAGQESMWSDQELWDYKYGTQEKTQ